MLSAKNVARVFEYLSLQSDGTVIEKTRLNKLLYFAQGHSLSELGHVLFSNQIDAWDRGPVVAVVYTGFDRIVDHARKNGISDVQVSPEEMDIILDVWDRYRAYSATELVHITHEDGSPWAETYKPTIKNSHIAPELIKQFFSRPENRLKRALTDVERLPTVTALPAEDYDSDEDSVWEELLNDTP